MQGGVTTRSRKSLYKLRGPSQLSENERARRSKNKRKSGKRKSVSKGSRKSVSSRKSRSSKSVTVTRSRSPAAERDDFSENGAVSASPRERYIEEPQYIENTVMPYVPVVMPILRESPYTRASASPQAFAQVPYRASMS